MRFKKVRLVKILAIFTTFIRLKKFKHFYCQIRLLISKSLVFSMFWCKDRQDRTKIGETPADSKFGFCHFSTKRAHLGPFFGRPKSNLFCFNTHCATNSGPILENSPLSAPPDLSGCYEWLRSLLGSSVLEEFAVKSTWYFFLGRRKYIHIICISFFSKFSNLWCTIYYCCTSSVPKKVPLSIYC